MSPTLRLTAPLDHDARAFTAADGSAWMRIQLRAEPGRVVAMVRMGQGPAAQHVAATAARRYRRGETVIVYARGWQIDYHDNSIQLEGVTSVELPPIGLDRLTPDTLPLEVPA